MRLEFDANAPVNSPAPAPDDKAKFTDSLNAGIKAAQAGERKKARSLLMTAAEIDPRSENAWLWLASISEYPEELLVFLNNVLDINPENERALQWSLSTKTLLSKTLVQRGIDAVEEGRNDFAMQCFDQALNYDERNQMAWLWIASIADSEDRKMEYLQRVLSIDPENESAKAQIQAAVEQSLAARLSDARLLAVRGDRSGAGELLDGILADFPENIDAWTLRSHLAESFEDKLSAWSRMLEIDPGNNFAAVGTESLTAIIESAKLLVSDAAHPASSDDLPAASEDAVRDPTQELVLPESFSPPKEDGPDVPPVPASEIENNFWVETAASVDEEPWSSVWSARPSDDELFVKTDEVDDNSASIDEFSVAEDHFASNGYDGDYHAEAIEFSDVQPDPEFEGHEIPIPDDSSFIAETESRGSDPYATNVEPAHEVVEFEPVEDDNVATVLVIDDNSTVRKLIAGKLEESGYRVVCAEDGHEGFNVARAEKPSLVLVDVAMPKVDGYQVCRMLRDDPTTSGVPVVMISGKDASYDEDLGGAVGASGFLTKPFGPEALMKVVEGHLSAA